MGPGALRLLLVLLMAAATSAAAAPTAAVIWMHGLGDSGAGWSFLQQRLGRALPHVAWSFPNAPMLSVAVNGGARMRAWFDLEEIPVTEGSPDDAASLDAGVRLVQEEVARVAQKHNIQSSRILVGGFSQGAAMALLGGLTAKSPLAGIVAFSGWLPLRARFPAAVAGAPNLATPVFMAHGTDDRVVLYALGQSSAKLLRQSGANLELKSYPGLEHSSSEQELDDLGAFIKRVLPA